MENENNSHTLFTKKIVEDLELSRKKHDIDVLRINATLVPVNSYQQIISDDLMWSLNLYINILLCGVMAFFGSLSNIVNITVFYQLGLRKSVDVCLFAVSLTDFVFCFAVTISIAFYVWDMFFPSESVDPSSIAYIAFNRMANSLFVCSGWITTFLAIERCVCVVFPFKVKQIFTRDRSVVIVTLIFIFIQANYVPMYSATWLEWVDAKEELTNKTVFRRRLVTKASKNLPTAERYVDIMAGNILPIASLGLILGSVLWMIYGLQISSKKREGMAAKSTGSNDVKQDSDITYRSRRLVKVVLFIAIIFTVCSVPRLCATYTNMVNPEINHGGRESNLSSLLWRIAHFAATINASVNIFVYVKVNSSYRQKFEQIFHYGDSISKREDH